MSSPTDPNDPLAIPQPTRPAEHAGDVLGFAAACLAHGQPVALAAVTETLGGAVRAPGALMAVDAAGRVCGYLSGGCIDADLALRAGAALQRGTAETVRYGVGSPYRDISLPCGGAITVAIDGAPDAAGIEAARAALARREPASLRVSGDRLAFAAGPGGAGRLARYAPKLRIRIAGRAADPVALASLAWAAGHDVAFWTPDADCAADARALGLSDPVRLGSVHALPEAGDDAWTAFILMFHDPHWEDVLLTQALAGPAFYIGAVGSPRTHAIRCQRLAGGGLDAGAIGRIRGPVGLLPSMRNASALAISALAEIVGAYEARVARSDLETDPRETDRGETGEQATGVPETGVMAARPQDPVSPQPARPAGAPGPVEIAG